MKWLLFAILLCSYASVWARIEEHAITSHKGTISLSTSQSSNTKEFTTDIIQRAKSGDAEAQSTLSLLYYAGSNEVEQNYKLAYKWAKKAAKQNHPHAIYTVGCCLYHGYGVKQNKQEAFSLFNLAASNGSDYAAYTLGILYYIGEELPKNRKLGISFLEAAAERGHLDAQITMADYWSKIKNYPLAEKYLILAAQQGDPKAQIGRAHV